MHCALFGGTGDLEGIFGLAYYLRVTVTHIFTDAVLFGLADAREGTGGVFCFYGEDCANHFLEADAIGEEGAAIGCRLEELVEFYEFAGACGVSGAVSADIVDEERCIAGGCEGACVAAGCVKCLCTQWQGILTMQCSGDKTQGGAEEEV